MNWQRPILTLPASLLVGLLLTTTSGTTSESSSGTKKGVKYRTRYYVPAEYRSSYDYQWPYQDPKFSRRSYTLWDDSYDLGGGGLALLPYVKGLLSGVGKQKHFHHHFGGKQGCGIEVALLGLVLFLPLMGLLGIVMPLMLLLLPLLMGLPALLQLPWALGPVIGVPGTPVGTQGRRRRATPARPWLEDALTKAADTLHKAMAKYGAV